MRIEISLPEGTAAQQALFGQNDANLRMLRTELGVKILTRGELLIIDGSEEPVQQAAEILHRLLAETGAGPGAMVRLTAALVEGVLDGPYGAIRTERGRIEPKTAGQRAYVQAVREHGLTFAIGPAGSGKTFLAVACAVEALRKGEVERLVLTRPAVEAGENLGFLPGDLREKVDPYLRPVYDALGEMVGQRQLAHYIDTGIIEVAPLAFMRGRTLNRSFVILDEAQNTTPGQMKMFLTRMGEKSHCVVTGDITQTDLAEPERCGLLHATKILADLPEVSIIRLAQADIVRHPLVAAIVRAYENEFSAPTIEPGRATPSER